MAHKHIGVSTWLEALGMLEYLPLFDKYGGVENLLHVGEAELRSLGIKNSAHRAKMVSSLHILQNKYQKGQNYADRGHSVGFISPSDDFQRLSSSSLPQPEYQRTQVFTEQLNQDLQKELNADPSELKSCPWYHGNITRQRAESLVLEDGKFLVRDCISRPGDFVLTCCWRGTPLHFMINALVGDSILGALPKIYYQFEEGSFNSIQDLIHFYQSKAKPVTNASSAVLKTPVARCMPLSYYDAKYGALSSLSAVHLYSHKASPTESPLLTPTGSPIGSPGMNRKGPKRTGSQPLLSVDGSERSLTPSIDRCDSLPVISTPNSSPQLKQHKEFQPVIHQRSGSAPILDYDAQWQFGSIVADHGGSDSNLSRAAPPKPSRIPSVKYKLRPVIEIRNQALYEDDGRDYSDYFQVRETPSWLTQNQKSVLDRVKQLSAQRNQDKQSSPDKCIYDNNFNSIKTKQRRSPDKTFSASNKSAHVITNFGSSHPDPSVKTGSGTGSVMTSTPNKQFDPSRARLFSDTRFSVIDTEESNLTEAILNDNQQNHSKQRIITVPKVRGNMNYNPVAYECSFLPPDNKPLEASVMISVKSMLLEVSPKVLSAHLTNIDLQALSILEEKDLGVGVHSGLELLTLPHGKQLRQNLIERCHCMKLMVLVTILTCKNTTERAQMVNQWIQTANELRTTLGNLFSFVNIMEGLIAPQIQRLRDTLLVLRQNHTASAFLFDTKLKTAYNALNDGSSSLPLQNVCIPHISPVVYLMERDINSVMDQLSWEEVDIAVLGTEPLLAHLDTARIVASQCALYRIVGMAATSDMKECTEVDDLFKTEMHLRLLWGQKGCSVNRQDRHFKFNQLLTVLSNRAEPPGDDGTAV